MDAFERLVDANIAVLSKTIESSKHGKTLKAEFVRDDGAGGKYYGYMRGGKVHIIHDRGFRRFGRHISTIPAKQQVGVSKDEGKPLVPQASQDSAVDFGGNKVQQWRRDADTILGGVQQQMEGESQAHDTFDREAGAVEATGGGGAVSPSQIPQLVGAGGTSKTQTGLENTIARLAEAEAQYIRVIGGKNFQNAFHYAIKKAQNSFKQAVLEKLKQQTGHDIIYDIELNKFRYVHPIGGTVELSPRDNAIVEQLVGAYVEEVRKIIKARTTAIRRAEGSDE